MKFLLLLLPLAVLALAVFGPLLTPGRSRRAREQAVTTRLALLTWLAAGGLLAGLVLLPEKGRVLLTLLPLYGVLAGVQAGWRRRPLAPEVELAEMKRARSPRPPAGDGLGSRHV